MLVLKLKWMLIWVRFVPPHQTESLCGNICLFVTKSFRRLGIYCMSHIDWFYSIFVAWKPVIHHFYGKSLCEYSFKIPSFVLTTCGFGMIYTWQNNNSILTIFPLFSFIKCPCKANWPHRNYTAEVTQQYMYRVLLSFCQWRKCQMNSIPSLREYIIFWFKFKHHLLQIENPIIYLKLIPPL